MTTVRIAHAEPRPGQLGDGRFAVKEVLVVLADDAGRPGAAGLADRAPTGHSALAGLPGSAGPGTPGIAGDAAGQLTGHLLQRGRRQP